MDGSDKNTAKADSMDEHDLTWDEPHGQVIQEEFQAVPADDRKDRPAYYAGLPDYACPKSVVENIRLSKPNVQPLLPAGIRVGDMRLPRRFEVRDQLRFHPGAVAYDPHLDPGAMHRRANTGDQFIVTGPLPCLKGVKMTYMRFDGVRQCTQCPKRTRIGILYVQ